MKKLIGSTIILLIILYYLTLIEPTAKTINGMVLGERVSVYGNVTSVVRMDKLTLFSVKDATGEIKGIIMQEVNIRIGDRINIWAKVEEYEGELELKAFKVISLD